jgi:membrane-bound lytic murein transglycosylase F
MRWFVPLITALLLAACDRVEPPKEGGELVVGVREAPALFQRETPDGTEASGFDHDLVETFAAALGLKPRYVTATDPQDLIRLLKEGKVHFVASLPVATGVAGVGDARGLQLTRPNRTAQAALVRHADALGPDSVDELAGHTVETVAGTPQVANLKAIPGPRQPLVIERTDIDDIALLERVATRASPLAATDTLSFRIAANFYPDLALAAELPGEVSFVWGFAADGDTALFERAQGFLRHIEEDGTLARIADRYFGHIRRVDTNGIARLLERRTTLLPKYRRDFVAAQEVTGIDWRLLAALAYQESQWNPLATSPTGVRGMMMLTEDTADRMKVSNRLDAAQSIHAGALYLANIIDDLQPSITGPDRTWLALAAYNLGQGHMNGARAIAAGLKRDPDSWYEMKKVLPLLARPEYYGRLKSGRARGGEAVIMVENVRTYFDVLSRFEPPLKFTLIPPFKKQ